MAVIAEVEQFLDNMLSIFDYLQIKSNWNSLDFMKI